MLLGSKRPVRIKYAALGTVLAAAAVMAALSPAVALRADVSYNSASDPVVTVSYVDSVRASLKTEILNEVKTTVTSEVSSQVSSAVKSSVTSEVSSQLSSAVSSEVAAQLKAAVASEVAAQVKSALADQTSASYSAVKLTKGQTILADSACELILRSGAAYAVVTDSANVSAGVGLSDLTSGSEVVDGEAIFKNHYLIASRPDGRGAKVTSGEAYFLVRGDYEIVG